MDALVANRRAEFGFQDVVHAPNDVVHDIHRRINDAEVRSRFGQGELKESPVKFGDDSLFARRIGHPAGAEADVAVEVFQAFGFFFQSAALQAVYCVLHRGGDGIEADELWREQSVEDGLGDEVL